MLFPNALKRSRSEITAGLNLFAVRAVNGSPAAAQLGILGSDTTNLNVGEVPLGAAVADGVIDGGKLATIQTRRHFLQILQCRSDSS